MDGSFVKGDVVAELQNAVLLVTTWKDIRKVVRDWATKYQFQPCTTTPNEAGLHIAYSVGWGDGFRKAHLSLPLDAAKRYLVEYEAGRGVW